MGEVIPTCEEQEGEGSCGPIWEPCRKFRADVRSRVPGPWRPNTYVPEFLWEQLTTQTLRHSREQWRTSHRSAPRTNWTISLWEHSTFVQKTPVRVWFQPLGLTSFANAFIWWKLMYVIMRVSRIYKTPQLCYVGLIYKTWCIKNGTARQGEGSCLNIHQVNSSHLFPVSKGGWIGMATKTPLIWLEEGKCEL